MSNSDTVKKYTLAQTLTEVALGSLAHALHIPLAGHLLSLNQSVLLTLALKTTQTRKSSVTVTSQISNTVAALKALSPFGARLKPMVGISVQGLLYSLGPMVFGPSFLGAILGSVLSSVWPFLQPLVWASLIFGTAFFEGLEKLWLEIAKYFNLSPFLAIQILAGFVLLKMIIAAGLAGFVWKSGPSFEERYFYKINQWTKKAALSAKAKGLPVASLNPTDSSKTRQWLAIQDIHRLLNPWFLISVILTVSFFIAARSPSFSDVILYILRIIATTLVITWSFRAFPASWSQWFTQRLPHLKEIKKELVQ
jgi:hypothetical protein